MTFEDKLAREAAQDAEIEQESERQVETQVRLAPCLHCGGEAKEEQTRGSFGGYGLKTVYCQECKSSSPNPETWNSRTQGLTDLHNLRDQTRENVMLEKTKITPEILKQQPPKRQVDELLGTIHSFEKCFVRIAKAYGLTPLILTAMAENNEESYAEILAKHIEQQMSA